MVDVNSGFTIRELTGLAWKERRGRDMETDEWTGPDHGIDGGAYALMRIDRGYLDLEQYKVSYVLQ